MSIRVTNHLNPRGDTCPALEFYQSVSGGGDIAVFTYTDAQNAQDSSEVAQVMWGQVAAKAWDPGQNGFFASVRGTSPEEITELWDKLSEGAPLRHAHEPLRYYLGPECGYGVQGCLSQRKNDHTAIQQ